MYNHFLKITWTIIWKSSVFMVRTTDTIHHNHIWNPKFQKYPNKNLEMKTKNTIFAEKSNI